MSKPQEPAKITKKSTSIKPGHSAGARPEGSAKTKKESTRAATTGPVKTANPPYKKNNKPQAPAKLAPSGGKKAPVSSAEDVHPGDRIIVTIKRIGINGEGVGYYKRKAVFINGVLPDEVVKADVVKAEPTYINAKLVEIEKTSPDRQTPPCPVYEACGGCQLQHMTYPSQLRAKEELVREAFARYAGMDKPPLRPILGMEEPWGYRNKAQLQVGWHNEHIITGLYSSGTHKVVDISGCPVQHPVINDVTVKVKGILKRLGILPYSERTRKGTVRTVVTRIGKQSGEVQLTLITISGQLPQAERFIESVRSELPMVSTIAQNINSTDTPLIFGDETRILWGSGRMDEQLGGLRFSLSPRAFFQLNPEQTVKLYDAVREAAGLTGGELVVDAYCGTGTIGLWLAPHAKEVRGIELIPEAVEDARRNAELSGAANAQFYAGQAEKLLPEWVARGVRPDVVVVDPPRSGCDRRLLDAIAGAKPARLVYVSCNPATLAKDCRVLLQSGYRLEWIQPVDMFPQTAHVECCVSLIRK